MRRIFALMWRKIVLITGGFFAAFSVFAGFEQWIAFAAFFHFCVERWQCWTRSGWLYVTSLIGIHIPIEVMDVLTFCLFVSISIGRIYFDARKNKFTEMKLENINKAITFRIVFLQTISGFFFLFLMGLASFSIFGDLDYRSILSYLISYTSTIIIVDLICNKIYGRVAIISINWSPHIWISMLVFSVCTILVIAILLAINYVGMHAGDIRAFFEEATKISK